MYDELEIPAQKYIHTLTKPLGKEFLLTNDISRQFKRTYLACNRTGYRMQQTKSPKQLVSLLLSENSIPVTAEQFKHLVVMQLLLDEEEYLKMLWEYK